jgi:hypothetical protein
METQQNTELVLQLAAIKKELQETKKRQGVFIFSGLAAFQNKNIMCLSYN